MQIKTIMRYYFISTRLATNKEPALPSVDKDVDQPMLTARGMSMGISDLENQLALFYKVDHSLSPEPGNSTPGCIYFQAHVHLCLPF